MSQELEQWVKKFYSGCEKAGKVELKAFNDKYSLCYLKGSTGYVGRMSGNIYCPSEWFVVENFAELDRMWNKPASLFHHEGRLTAEQKEEIAVRFDLEVPKQKRKESIKPVDKWLIAIEHGAFWGGDFTSPIYYQRIIKEEDNKFTTFSVNRNQNVTFNKNKYYYIVVDIDDLEGTLKNIQNLVVDYKQISSKLRERQTEILGWFNK
jgi:hypothetical protein